ncbi:Lipid-A-disaccharide synthase [Planktothrix tepida]|uniref:Lipid-A-disaccharide synthase n=2 Tax=Planktothrix TaxID=54304 RepID=A0A1J1LNL0_9CYAN|nr:MULTISPECIES: lipid-A-disaccharide synthase [Planktothrix]CAD5954885.1 Lipid-A-disaccharide synthase [Planktothrix pseudagardhii]CAD5955616.1 Lipid-A-disaccharide synthase [Planktothrix tepida]CUR34157.1 Lipid-A-disaccharide synthase [Planktothrix tepida PCC 9214]
MVHKTPPIRIFISTGEVSGDLQGSLLIEALFRQAKKAGILIQIIALGGEKMASAGAKLLGNTTGIGSVGILESIPYIIPTYLMQKQVKHYLKEHPPDLVILIDYMGPNIGMGNFIKHNLPTIPIFYYIAPQEWVWSLGSKSTAQIVKLTNRILAIFPEEARYFQSKGAKVTWVGHPLLDRMKTAPSREESRRKLGIQPDEIAIALLPASRWQEIKYLMPILFEAAQQIQAKIPQVKFWIPLSLPEYKIAIETAIKTYQLNAVLVSTTSYYQTLEVLSAADLAIAKSGTVNLEIALLKVPQVVVYRVSALTAWVARHLLKFSIPFMSPTNLVQMQAIVPELLQEKATPENIVQEAIELLTNPQKRQEMLNQYQQMKQALGEEGVCDRAALEILKSLSL